jgi:hypothetical protein
MILRGRGSGVVLLMGSLKIAMIDLPILLLLLVMLLVVVVVT